MSLTKGKLNQRWIIFRFLITAALASLSNFAMPSIGRASDTQTDSTADADKLFSQGLRLRNRTTSTEDAVEGLRLLERAAALGNANAAVSAAAAYATGDRVEKDGRMAMRLLDGDALRDNAFAWAWKGWLWQNGWKPSQTAIGQIESQIHELHTSVDDLLKQSRELEGNNDKYEQWSALNTKMLELLTKISTLHNETNYQIDINKAADCYSRNLAISYMQASSVNLGIIDLLGSRDRKSQESFVANPEAGFGLLERPAREGNSDALFFRAFALERGIGVRRDVAAAREIYAKPELKNYSRAQIALRRTENSVLTSLAEESKTLSALVDVPEIVGKGNPDYTRGLSDFSLVYRAMTDFQTVELINSAGKSLFFAQLKMGESVALNVRSPEIIHISNILSKDYLVGYVDRGQNRYEVHQTYSIVRVDVVDIVFNTNDPRKYEVKTSEWTLEAPSADGSGLVLHDPTYTLRKWNLKFSPDPDRLFNGYAEPYLIPSAPRIILRIRGGTQFMLRFQARPVFEWRVPSGRVLVLDINTTQATGRWSTLETPEGTHFPSELDSLTDFHGVPTIVADGVAVGWLLDAYDPKEDGIIAEFVPGGFEYFINTALRVKRDYKAATRLAKALLFRDLVSEGPNSPKVAADRIELGEAFAACGDDQAAISAFESGLNTWVAIAGPISAKQLPGLLATFKFFNARGETDRAALALYQALAISAAVSSDSTVINNGGGPKLIERVPSEYLNIAAEFLGKIEQFERQRAYLFELTAREVSANPYQDVVKVVYDYVSLAEAEAETQSGGDAKPFLAAAHPYALADTFAWRVWNLPEPLPTPFPVPPGTDFLGEWAKSELHATSVERLGKVYFMEGRYSECANAMSAASHIYQAAGSSALSAAAWDAICETNLDHLEKAQTTLLEVTGWTATPGTQRRLVAGTQPDTINLVYDAWLKLVQHQEVAGDLSHAEAGAELFEVFKAADRDKNARAEAMALSGSGLSALDQDLISSWRKARARLYSVDRRLASSSMFEPLTISSATTAASSRREREEARSDFERLDQMVTAELDRSASSTPRSIDTPAQLQSQLAADEVTIDILPLRFGLGLLAVAKDRIEFRYVPIAERSLNALVARYRAALDPTSRGSAAFDPGPLFALGKLMLEPLRELIQGKKRLTLIPHGEFQAIPLEALPLNADLGSPGKVPSDSVRYLGLEHEITYASSIASLWLSRTASPTPSKGRPAFVGIGDPVIGHPELRQRIAGAWDSFFSWRGGGLSFSTLPETRDEIFRLREIFGGAVQDTFLAAGATLQSLLNSDDIKSSRVIDFATHGVTAGKFGSALVDQPFLLMSPSGGSAVDDAGTRLRMSDVMSMHLQADLVILSACDTAASDGSPGSLGLSGLASAFLLAGARNVLVSHWEVESRTAYYFVTQFAENVVSKRMSYAAALLAARRSIAIDRGLLDPSYWSAFILLGDGNDQFIR